MGRGFREANTISLISLQQPSGAPFLATCYLATFLLPHP